MAYMHVVGVAMRTVFCGANPCCLWTTIVISFHCINAIRAARCCLYRALGAPTLLQIRADFTRYVSLPFGWSRPSSFWCVASSSAVLTSFSLIIMLHRPQYAFWISHPFSGLRSIATYIGSPWLIQCPPWPYQREMDSLTQIKSDGIKSVSR